MLPELKGAGVSSEEPGCGGEGEGPLRGHTLRRRGGVVFGVIGREDRGLEEHRLGALPRAGAASLPLGWDHCYVNVPRDAQVSFQGVQVIQSTDRGFTFPNVRERHVEVSGRWVARPSFCVVWEPKRWREGSSRPRATATVPRASPAWRRIFKTQAHLPSLGKGGSDWFP